jgi:FkbH-like protein
MAVNANTVRSEVDEYCRKLLLVKNRARVMFVPTWVVPAFHAGHGMLDLAAEVGVSRILMQANMRLLENLDGHSNVFPLNAAKWVELAGEKAFNPRLWYLGKVPFGNELFKTAVSDLKAGLRGIQGRARKLVILDLDDTLWGGIVGEVGWQEIMLGGHDPAGEALVDFQRELKALTRRGIVLAIASKNEESIALEAIGKHSEMVLRKEDFAGWRINWKDKAQNIVELAAELNLGLDSAVFIDDNPAERARVREALPDVFVPEWPADKRLYPHTLRSLNCFDKPAISAEDRQRQQMYTTERRRKELKGQVGSVEEWLRTLDLVVKVEPLGTSNLGRSAQLLNKTNQMNLSTRRMTEQEYLAWAGAKNHRVWSFYVSDRFGDSGLTGILGVEAADGWVTILDFVLSCRVMGRKVEEAMLHVAVDWARSARIKEVRADYYPNAKNKPCLDFFLRSGMQKHGENRFVLDATQEYPLHPAVRLVHETVNV